MAIKVLIFDVGGVLYKDIEKYMVRDIARNYHRSYADLMKVRSKWWRRYATDAISEREYWQGFLQESGIEGDWKKFRRLPYKKYTILVKGIVPLIHRLQKHYPLFILSDHAREWARPFKKSPLAQYFQGFFFSYEWKSLKKEKHLFSHATNSINAKPSEILFIDNTKENITIAKTFGLQTIHFKNIQQCARELKKKGIRI